jgi:hypothetical protein
MVLPGQCGEVPKSGRGSAPRIGRQTHRILGTTPRSYTKAWLVHVKYSAPLRYDDQSYYLRCQQVPVSGVTGHPARAGEQASSYCVARSMIDCSCRLMVLARLGEKSNRSLMAS